MHINTKRPHTLPKAFVASALAEESNVNPRQKKMIQLAEVVKELDNLPASKIQNA